MRVRLQNIAFQIFIHKKILSAGVVLVLLLAFFPLHVAQANWIADALGFAIKNAVDPVLNLIFGSIATIVELIFKAIAGVMMGIINYSMSLTVTPDPNLTTTPGMVTQGWNTTRNIVNILFILILTFIGLATILRLQTYQLQKTLPSLIIIALLVNFSGVFVGFIVDIGNIMTRVFLEKVIGEWEFVGIGDFSASPVGQIVKIIFYLVASLIYFVLMLLFLIRIAMLWVLTMLAPLAFGAYILPATKKYWTQWLGQLIQWSILGIPVSFFMYLAKQAITMGSVGNTALMGGIGGWFIAPFTALMLLYIGITLSMQMAPAGAQGIVNFGKSVPGKLAQTRLGAKALGGVASGTQKILAGTAPALKRLEQKAGIAGPIIAPLTRPIGWATRGANKAWGGDLIEYAASKRKLDLPKNFDQMNGPELEAYAETKTFPKEDLVQFAAKMQEKKKLKHTSAAFKKEVGEARDRVASNPYFQDTAGVINDALPETVTKDVFIKMEMSTKVTEEEKREAGERAEREIQEVKTAIEGDLGNEEIMIQTGLKFGHVNKEEVKSGRDAALLKIQGVAGIKEQKEQFLGDLAAAKKYTQELKPQDIPNVIDPKSLAFRLAMRDSNPESLHREVANFDKATLEDTFKGVGGLDGAADTKDKLIALARRNRKLVQALLESPGYKHIDWVGRKVFRETFSNRIDDLWEEVEGGSAPAGTPTPTPGGPPPSYPTTTGILEEEKILGKIKRGARAMGGGAKKIAPTAAGAGLGAAVGAAGGLLVGEPGIGAVAGAAFGQRAGEYVAERRRSKGSGMGTQTRKQQLGKLSRAMVRVLPISSRAKEILLYDENEFQRRLGNGEFTTRDYHDLENAYYSLSYGRLKHREAATLARNRYNAINSRL